MAEFRIDIQATVNSALFVINKLNQRNVDFHKLFKILYFADRKHIATYGKPITGDTYVAMTRGPVPSELYDILKYNRGDELLFVPPAELLPLIKNLKVILPYYVKAESEPNLDYLSASSIEMLEWSVAQHGDKSFDALTTESHDVAYDKASENADISYKDMAEAENVSDEMKAYIALNIENAQSLHAHAGLNR